jgi:acetyltransferase-like isoleucine patch superfamily enzyme
MDMRYVWIIQKNRINTYGKSKEIVIEDNVWIGTNVLSIPSSYIFKVLVIMVNIVEKVVLIRSN